MKEKNQKEYLDNLRHTCAHLLAKAVKDLWPGTHNAIGPSIEDGFYQDFDFGKVKISEEDLQKIEKRMRQIVENWKQFKFNEVTVSEAKKLFKDNPYKLELIEDFSKEGKKLTTNNPGDFLDLCKMGHIENPSKELKNFKLLKIAGAYWRGNEKNTMLTRIYGTAFSTKEELDSYLKMLEESKKRDHRVLGEKLGLIMFTEYSPGAPMFLPKGAIIYNELLKLLREEYKKRGYQEVITPLLYEKGLWETSGHWEFYKDNMFSMESEKRIFNLKPMNCPSHCLIYKHKIWSYKELPLRIADFAPLHRNELSGTLSGLTRVRKFSQDDSHIFVTEEQLEKEIENVLDFEKYIYNDIFKLDYYMRLGTRPDEFMGEVKLWDKAEKILAKLLKDKKIKHVIKEKEGAFYGPKIDLMVKDALNREWQLATIQVDFQIPLRFNLTYEGSDGKKHTPIIIHRAIMGSIERFFALIIENYAGKFPLWLSPTQVAIMTIADRHVEYAKKLREELEKDNIKVDLDDRTESIAKKVRDNQAQYINYLITIGDKEMESNNLAIRTRDNNVINMNKEEFIKKIVKEIKERC
ncbi:threonine--tRNA ligase [Candidatus Woesearchaeota archaeon]|nr:threonine--tRNA ligase [Candidatus Woesearchaeota archaeon]